MEIMYLDVTLPKYLCEYLHVMPSEIYKFDNANGTTGFRVTHLCRLTRVQISKIERETDLFLKEVILDYDIALDEPGITAEFIKI
jgi:hypothetical protein